MKPVDRAGWSIVAVTILLFLLAYFLPPGGGMEFFPRLAERRQEWLRPAGRSAMRGPVRLPVPQRYIEATRAEVERRMAAPDWKGLAGDRKRQILLEILILSAADAEYWTMPESRQRRVSDAYVRAFLGAPAGIH